MTNNCLPASVNTTVPISILGTPLQLTTYAELTEKCRTLAAREGTVVIDFSNTQIVTMRRHEPGFRSYASKVDYFIPDGMPLIWCLNLQGAGLRDRVYGPSFMRHCVLACPAPVTHYFIGGSEEKLALLEKRLGENNPQVRVVGRSNGYDQPGAEVVADINRLSPDFIWVGLGTPKQQNWIRDHRAEIKRGVILAVGFAFDVIAGTKKDAPPWMQKRGLTWLYRLASEPRRLASRYLKYNSLFLFYLLWDGLRGRAFNTPHP